MKLWIVIFALCLTNTALSDVTNHYVGSTDKVAKWQRAMIRQGGIILKDIYALDPAVINDLTITELKTRLKFESLYKTLISDERINDSGRLEMDMMAALAAIFWFLSDKGQVDAESIAFNIGDANGSLFQFFKRYIELAISGKVKHDKRFLADLYEKSIEKSGGIAKNWYSSGNSRAYPRDPRVNASSHLTNIDNEQWGIDFRSRDGTLLKILPRSKSHLIVAQFQLRGEPRLFLKPEVVGLGTTGDMLSHGFDFLRSQGEKEGYRGEKIDKNPALIKQLENLGLKKPQLTKPLTLLIEDLQNLGTKPVALTKFKLWLADTFGPSQAGFGLGCEVVINSF